jgi:hypothetical protein
MEIDLSLGVGTQVCAFVKTQICTL